MLYKARNFRTIAVVSLSALLVLGGCTTTGGRTDYEATGTAAGAVLGAALGYGLGKGHSNKELAVAAGAALGGLLGNKIGIKLNAADQAMMGQSVNSALEYNPTGVASTWVNPDTGTTGTATPTRTYSTVDQGPCREYSTTVTVGGKEQEAFGTACRQSDGSWKIVD